MLEIDKLIEDISEDLPSGGNLEYDPAFTELERLIQGKPEQEMGESIVPAEPPNWKEVRKNALDLFARTKDLRIATILVRALLETEGLTGLRDGLLLLPKLLERHWETIHPQLDPDDNNDPTERINALVSLSDQNTILLSLRETPLVQSKVFGRFCLRDIIIASGGGSVQKEGESPPEMSAIEAAFTDAPIDAVQATTDAVRDGIVQVRSLESFVTEKVGVSNAPDFNGLTNLLKEMEKFLSTQLGRKGVSETQTVSEVSIGTEGDPSTQGVEQVLTGRITSREDVFRALDKIIDYYKVHEPSSPVPLLLNRAKQLISKGFMEILQDLVPDGLSQAETICGPNDRE